MVKKTLIDEIQETIKSKASFANISAFIIIVSGCAYALITEDSEAMKSVLFLGAGYLFGASASQVVVKK